MTVGLSTTAIFDDLGGYFFGKFRDTVRPASLSDNRRQMHESVGLILVLVYAVFIYLVVLAVFTYRPR